MYYSVMSSDFIFKDWDDFNPEVEYIKKDNLYLKVEKLGEEQKQIQGIVSTDPADYLKQELNPGTLLN